MIALITCPIWIWFSPCILCAYCLIPYWNRWRLQREIDRANDYEQKHPKAATDF